MFDVYDNSGAEYVGYIFRLVPNAVVPFAENENIGVIYAPKNVFVTKTLENILDFVPPEMILYIERDYVIYLDPTPMVECDSPLFAPHAFAPVNDPRFREQWGLEFIRGPAAWSTTPAVSTNGIVVAVIDSGINRNHPDLNASNILPGRNFFVSLCNNCAVCADCVNNRTRPATDTSDDCGHGTYVAGVIAATRGNGIGIASMACGVTILPLRVFTGTGANRTSRHSIVATAIYHAVSQGAHIINMSLSYPSDSDMLRDAINYVVRREDNIWMIASAGNYGHISGGTAMRYPAGFLHVIGVGATTRHGVRWYRSQQNSSVFVTAPGAEILTTSTGTGYTSPSGTSLATPHITALAAIARGHNSNMTVTTFRNLLRDSAIPRGFPTHNASNQRVRNNQYGYGIVDVGLFMYNLTRRDFFNFTDAVAPTNVTAQTRSHILEVARYGLMHGRIGIYTSDRNQNLGSRSLFRPTAYMWRLELPMALGRLHELNGRNIPWVNATFPDANTEALFPYNYSRYVAWAASTTFAPGRTIVTGFPDGSFRPGAPVTRAEAAAMFYRYARFLARTCFATERRMTEARGRIGEDARDYLARVMRFPDAGVEDLNDWAVNYMAWVVATGLMEGRANPGGRNLLAAEANIERAEGATLLSRYRRTFLPNSYIIPRGASGSSNVSNTGFALGGTTSNPTIPAAIPPVPMLVGDNIIDTLSWFQGGILANGPTRDGYRFVGWYLDAAFTIPVTNETTVPATEFTLNARWAPPPVLTTTIFDDDWRTTINIRFFLDGALASLPLEDIQLIADGVLVADIRDFTINVAGWQTETTAIFINKLAPPWLNMTVNITAYGQTVTHHFVNNMFVPPMPTHVVIETMHGWDGVLRTWWCTTGQLRATVYPLGADQTVVWSSSSLEVIGVDQNGNVWLSCDCGGICFDCFNLYITITATASNGVSGTFDVWIDHGIVGRDRD